MLVLFHHPKNELSEPVNLVAAMSKYAKTDVDLHTQWAMDFPKVGPGARASLSVSIAVNSPKDVTTRIQGDKGCVRRLSLSVL